MLTMLTNHHQGRRLALLAALLQLAVLSSHLKPVSSLQMVENSVKFALDRCKQFLQLAEFIRPDALAENREIRKTKKICDHIVQIEGDLEDDDDDGEVDDVKSDVKKDVKSDVKKGVKSDVKVDVKKAEVSGKKSDDDAKEDGGDVKEDASDVNDDDAEPNRDGNDVIKPAKTEMLSLSRKYRGEKANANVIQGSSGNEKGSIPFDHVPGSGSGSGSRQPCLLQLFPRQDLMGQPHTLRRSLNQTLWLDIKSLRLIGRCSWKIYRGEYFRGDYFRISGKSTSHEDKELKRPSRWGWKVGEIRSVKRVRRRRRRGKKRRKKRKKKQSDKT